MCSNEVDDSEIGRESNFVVVTRDSEGWQCYRSGIKVDIFTPKSDPLKTELKNKYDKYTGTHSSQCVGQHSQLTVTDW